MLLCGSATAPAMAALFGMSERSMRRRLAAGGTSLRELANRDRVATPWQQIAQRAYGTNPISR